MEDRKDVFYIDKPLFESVLKVGDKTSDARILRRLSYVNRINALAAIMSARHGWLGATFSCAEILTYLYFSKMKFLVGPGGEIAGDLLILSKGHAAPMQYACLAGCGLIPFEDLLTYKMKDGLQAHTDRATPGIISNTGSLGQSLSKACGLALADRLCGRRRNIYVIIGDGELQEGQNYEALQTLKKYRLTEVVPVIDRNYLQTDSSVRDIKDIGDLVKIFSAFGFRVRSVNGHEMEDIKKTFGKVPGCSEEIIVAETVKGFGSRVTAMKRNIPRRKGEWHSRVPSTEEYIRILGELVKKTESKAILSAYEKFKSKPPSGRIALVKKTDQSTRDIFSERIVALAKNNKKIIVLDADLEKSLRLTKFATKYPERFIESGIAEQDMVSIAGGLALNGFLPVVNTYASFLRRAYEQIYINATELTPVLYAGHYSGLCYSTDGKSHLMTGDIPMFRAIPGMRVYDPFCNEEVVSILDYYLSGKKAIDWNYPVYIKLRRSPVDYRFVLRDDYKFSIDGFSEIVRGKGVCLVPCGPHLTSTCFKIASELMDFPVGVAVSSAQNYLNEKKVCEILSKYKKVIVIEESTSRGGFADEISDILNRNNLGRIKIIRKGVDDFTFSSRDKSVLFRHFGIDINGIISSIKRR